MTAAPLRIGIVCYPTYGGSGVVATELGKALADQGHEVHFITYTNPVRLGSFHPRVFYHEVEVSKYPLFDYPPYELVLTSKMVEVATACALDLLHVHYAIPHASAALNASGFWPNKGIAFLWSPPCTARTSPCWARTRRSSRRSATPSKKATW